MEITLKKVGEVIAHCWNQAEGELTKEIAEAHPKPSEEEITFLLEGQLRRAIQNASAARDVERALLADIKAQVPNIAAADLGHFKGLVASVNKHDKKHEGDISAADLGIVILRPRLSMMSSYSGRIQCDRDLARGLLAQAKRSERSRTGRFVWDSFTEPQRLLYPKRRPYYSLLLYRLSGDKLDVLAPIRWQLCHEYTFLKASKWLRNDSFPQQEASSQILSMLFHGSIGTENTKIINEVIAPKPNSARVIEIRISWPDGEGPPPSSKIHRTQVEHEQLLLMQRLRQ